MSVAFLFPGQGAQHPNMLHELPEHPEVQRTIEEASEVLGRNVLELDTKESLASTVSVQLSLLISGVALARVLKSYGAVPDIVAGHSIGSFAAAVVCGTLDFKDALSLVEIRAKMMEMSFPQGYGMGAIVGIDEYRATSLVEKVNTKESPVYIANINTDSQIVISGKISAIEEVFTLAHNIGVYKTKILNVSVPSHCELLDDISKELEKKISNITLKTPKALFVGNCRARGLRKAEDIGKELADGIANTVRWYDSTVSMYERGVRLFVELGPGETLTNMAKSEFLDARCISALNSGIESTCILIKREKDR